MRGWEVGGGEAKRVGVQCGLGGRGDGDDNDDRSRECEFVVAAKCVPGVRAMQDMRAAGGATAVRAGAVHAGAVVSDNTDTDVSLVVPANVYFLFNLHDPRYVGFVNDAMKAAAIVSGFFVGAVLMLTAVHEWPVSPVPCYSFLNGSANVIIVFNRCTGDLEARRVIKPPLLQEPDAQ